MNRINAIISACYYHSCNTGRMGQCITVIKTYKTSLELPILASSHIPVAVQYVRELVVFHHAKRSSTFESEELLTLTQTYGATYWNICFGRTAATSWNNQFQEV